MITSAIREALYWLYLRSVDLETWAINRKMKQVRGKLTPASIITLRESLSYEGKQMLDDEISNAYYQGAEEKRAKTDNSDPNSDTKLFNI